MLVQVVKQQANLGGLLAPGRKQGEYDIGLGREIGQQWNQDAFFNIALNRLWRIARLLSVR